MNDYTTNDPTTGSYDGPRLVYMKIEMVNPSLKEITLGGVDTKLD